MEVPQQNQKEKKIHFRTGDRRQKGRRSLPIAENRKTGKKEPYAYTFKDRHLGELKVLSSANAWWDDDGVKLQLLINAYKFYATDEQACYYAGISMTQLKYFQELHPGFYPIKHACKQSPNILARKTIVDRVSKDPDLARWWLERTEKDAFSSRQENTGAGGRDLFEQASQELKSLGEKLRNIEQPDDDTGDNKGTAEKHPAAEQPGHADAGPDGHGDEAAPAADTPQAPGVSDGAGKPVQD